MAKARISLEDVIRIANELTKQGEYPSVSTVRDALGSGSFTTINKHLQAWKEEREAGMVQRSLPEAVEASYRKAAAHAWMESERLSQEKITQAAEQAKIKEAQLNKQYMEALAEVERVEKLLQEATVKNQQIFQSLESIHHAERQSSEEKVKLMKQVEFGQTRISELTDDLENERTEYKR